MFKKKSLKPDLPKEYVFTLLIDDEEKLFKCLVTETEVITFEGDVEHKHLKITNPLCGVGVLQIDTQTKIYGDMIEFQLERFIPYIRLDGHWVMSDTTEQDRLQEQVRIYKRQSLLESLTGGLFLLGLLVWWLINGTAGNAWILSVFGLFFITSAVWRMARLKLELDAIKEAKQKEEEEKAAKAARAARLAALKAAEEN